MPNVAVMILWFGLLPWQPMLCCCSEQAHQESPSAVKTRSPIISPQGDGERMSAASIRQAVREEISRRKGQVTIMLAY